MPGGGGGRIFPVHEMGQSYGGDPYEAVYNRIREAATTGGTDPGVQSIFGGAPLGMGGLPLAKGGVTIQGDVTMDKKRQQQYLQAVLDAWRSLPESFKRILTKSRDIFAVRPDVKGEVGTGGFLRLPETRKGIARIGTHSAKVGDVNDIYKMSDTASHELTHGVDERATSIFGLAKGMEKTASGEFGGMAEFPEIMHQPEVKDFLRTARSYKYTRDKIAELLPRLTEKGSVAFREAMKDEAEKVLQKPETREAILDYIEMFIHPVAQTAEFSAKTPSFGEAVKRYRMKRRQIYSD